MGNEDTDKKETDDSTPKSRSKPGLKFAPRVLPKKTPKIIPKKETHEENKALTIDRKLIARIGTFQMTGNPVSEAKAEKQETPVQVSFGQAGPSVPRTIPTPRSSSTGASAVKSPKEHDESWDYKCTNYPVTLPLRRPNSGDTGSPDEEEFGQSSSRAKDGELSTAEELGLLERVDMPQLLFFQFPTSLPLPSQIDPVAKTETDTNVNANAKSMGDYRKRKLGCSLKELPCGLMGKVHVYKSGKVKMMLGDVLFDVAVGSNGMFAQEVVASDIREKHCCGLGELGKHAIVTPDVDYLLGSIKTE